jgi:hypothetical protein
MPRGGMSPRPFGGCSCKDPEKSGRNCSKCGKYNPQRLDRFDLIKYIQHQECLEGGKIPHEQLIWLVQVQSAANDWLFFGLSEKNGITVDKFWEAHRYLHLVRSTAPDTWSSRVLRATYEDEVTGKRKTEIIHLSDNQMRAGCFDVHYELSGLAKHMHPDRFLGKLKSMRELLVRQNWDTINERLDFMQADYLNREIARGRQIPFKFINRFEVLTNPKDGRDVAELVFYESRFNKPQTKPDKPHRHLLISQAGRKRPLKALGAGSLFDQGEVSAEVVASSAGDNPDSGICRLSD